MSTYLLLKFVHVVAVVLFLGNVSLGLFWVAHAERSGDPRLIAHAMDGVIRSDRWITWPGVSLIVLAGVAAAVEGGLPLLRTGWIACSIALFGLSGLVFGLFLAPLQRKIVAVASASGVEGLQLQRMLRSWHGLGWLSLLPLWLAVACMVLRVPH